MKDTLPQEQSPKVASEPKQGEEIRARWAWVEEAVWTTPMLEALERGVKGGKWFCLIDKVSAMTTLQRAWQAAEQTITGILTPTLPRSDSLA